MNRQVVIVGAGGHARVVADIVRLSGDEVVGFLDDRDPSLFPGIKILGKISDISTLSEQYELTLGIGDNAIRQRIMETYQIQWYTAVHPTAVIADDVTINMGTVVMANAVVNVGTVIGKGAIINTAATVDHDNIIGDYVHLSPGVHLAGAVCVGSMTWLGIGAIVSNNIAICRDCIIGAGAAVLRDISQSGTYVGIPARRITNLP